MKVFFNRVPKNGPWGGGNQFLSKMINSLIDRGHEVVFHLSENVDVIFLMDPRPEDGGYSINHAIQYKKDNPSTRIVHRINECDMRKGTNGLDNILLGSANNADEVVFISEWLKRYFEKKGFLGKSHVIYNGCDLDVFYPATKRERDISRKIKLVTHHWSNNWMKGFDIYTQLDRFLSENPESNFEFTYVGRYNDSYQPVCTNIVEPLHGALLGNELRKHDVYVTASRFEPCGMHHVEAAASGMPVLFHEDAGGIVELCQKHGLQFNDFQSFLVALEEMIDKYDVYKKKIDFQSLSITKCCHSFLEIIENQK